MLLMFTNEFVMTLIGDDFENVERELTLEYNWNLVFKMRQQNWNTLEIYQKHLQSSRVWNLFTLVWFQKKNVNKFFCLLSENFFDSYFDMQKSHKAPVKFKMFSLAYS